MFREGTPLEPTRAPTEPLGFFRELIWRIRFGKRNKEKAVEEFSAREAKEILAAIEGEPADSVFFTVKGIAFPRPGHIFRVKEGTAYTITTPGSLVFVTGVSISKTLWEKKENKTHPEVFAIYLNKEGRVAVVQPVAIRASDLEPIATERTIFDFWKKPAVEQHRFKDGEAVETTEEITVAQEVPVQGAMIAKFPAGIKGVISIPKMQSGASLSSINSPYPKMATLEFRTEIEVKTQNYYEIVGRTKYQIPLAEQGLNYEVYFPELGWQYRVNDSLLKPRTHDRGLIHRIVLNEDIRERVIALVSGKEEDMERWGITKTRQGQGMIFLLFGNPGFGKTLTGWGVAEFLGRPLYKVSSADLGIHTHEYEQRLRRVIERTVRWNAVTIIDEAEPILLSRNHGGYDATLVVTATLRSIERLERGVLWFTTNRPFEIDFAISSRIHAQVHIPPFTPEQRSAVWRMTLPTEMEIEGFSDAFLAKLGEIPLDGREIKNAIITAATTASAHGCNTVPGDVLLKTAETIVANRKILDDARKEGGRYGNYL